MFLSRRRHNQWALSSEYGVHNTQPVDFPSQSPTVPQMTQENRLSAYGVGARATAAQASPRRYVSAMFYLLRRISDSGVGMDPGQTRSVNMVKSMGQKGQVNEGPVHIGPEVRS
jgi:hypothetical protein